jgi:hypothetical protein
VRSLNYLKASGAPDPVVEDAEQLLRKLRGGNKRPKPKVDVANAGSPTVPVPANTRSTSQMSFDNQLGHFQAYIEILKTISEYNPNEADLKVTALTAYADDLIEKNNAVNMTSAAVTQARGTRDRLLYLDDDSVVNTARQVKSYIQAALGSDSALFMKIKGLSFAGGPR